MLEQVSDSRPFPRIPLQTRTQHFPQRLVPVRWKLDLIPFVDNALQLLERVEVLEGCLAVCHQVENASEGPDVAWGADFQLARGPSGGVALLAGDGFGCHEVQRPDSRFTNSTRLVLL